MDAALSPVQMAEIAARYSIPYDILYGLVGVESGNDVAHLSRWEPAVGRALSVAPESPDRWLATSVGPGHVLGYRLREMGYTGDVWALATPEMAELATEYAAAWLVYEYDQVLADRGSRDLWDGDLWEWAVNRYNSGSFTWQTEHMDRFARWRRRAEEPGTLVPLLVIGASLFMGSSEQPGTLAPALMSAASLAIGAFYGG